MTLQQYWRGECSRIGLLAQRRKVVFDPFLLPLCANQLSLLLYCL